MDLERNIPAEAKRKTNGTGHHYMRNLTYDTMDLAMEQNHACAEQAGAAKGEGERKGVRDGCSGRLGLADVSFYI